MSTLLAALIVLSPAQCPAPDYTSQYDRLLRNAVMAYWPIALQDWCLLKAQAIAESSLNPNAVSRTGAQCLLQLEPATAKEVAEKHGISGNVFDPRHCIQIGALYMSWLFHYYSAERPNETCRWEVAVAAYNAGIGNVGKAQRLAGGALCWPQIAPYLASVTGLANAQSTIYYVDHVKTLREDMN